MIFTQMLKKNFITISGNETEANWHCQWQAAYLSSLCFDYKTESLYCQNRQKLLFLFLRIFVRSLMQVPCRKSMTETLYIYIYVSVSLTLSALFTNALMKHLYTPRLKHTQVKHYRTYCFVSERLTLCNTEAANSCINRWRTFDIII